MAELLAYARAHRVAASCLIVVTITLLALRLLSTPIDPPRAEQTQFLSYAYNMLAHRVFSAELRSRPLPDQMREPGYPVLLAGAMLLHPGLDLVDGPRCIVQGREDCAARIIWLKLINLVFLGLSGLAVFAALLAVTGRPLLAWIGHLWVMLSAGYASYAGLFFPEIVAGFLIVILSLRLWRLASQPPRRMQWLASGLLLGVLVLFKASFYYLTLPLAIALAVHAARRWTIPARDATVLGMIFLGGTLAVTAPWHARNLVSTGSTELAGRGGVILTARANYDSLSADEMMAAAALFSPPKSRAERELRSRWLTPELKTKLQGRSDPRDRAFARLEELSKETGLNELGPQLDQMLKSEALHRIAELWPRHLLATVLFGYRGLFSEDGLGFVPQPKASTLGGTLLNLDPSGWLVADATTGLLLFLPAIAAFVFCVATARWPLVLLMLPVAYLFGFQALLTDFIPRYGAALVPMLVVTSVITLAFGWIRAVTALDRWRQSRVEPDAAIPVPSQLWAHLRQRPARAVALSVTMLALLALRAADMPMDRPAADQSQYLAYAHNMVTRARYNANWGGSRKADQRREPGYPVLLGAAMLLHPGLKLATIPTKCMTAGEPKCLNALSGLKVVNLIFLGLSGIAVYAAVLVLTGTHLLAWVGFLWVLLSASYGGFAVRFFPEVMVGFLIVALSMRLWRIAIRPPQRRAWYFSGLLLGILVMFKATFYYLAPIMAVALSIHAAKRNALPWRSAAMLGLVFLAGTLTLTVPWQLRNLISTGSTNLAGRAGLVLTVRANYDELSPEEMLGAAAVFSPSHSIPERYFDRWLTPPLEERLTGPNNPRDMGYVRQGELQSEHDLSVYDARLDRLMKEEALARIRANWPAHLRATLLFAYRGLFADYGLGYASVPDEDDRAPHLGSWLVGFSPSGWIVPTKISTNFLLFGMAFGTFAYCAATSRWPLVFLILPAGYLYAIQAFMTHYIPRYSTALIPMLVATTLVAGAALVSALLRWRAGHEVGADVEMHASDERGLVRQ